MKKMIKRIVFAVIIVSLVLATGVVIKTGKFAKLEGYMYSFAAEIINSATDSNATSSNAQDCATSSNATSSNAQDCATSSNAQQCATSSNATSSNAQITETIKVTNTKPSTPTNTEQEEIEEEVQIDLTYNNSEITQDILENISNSTEFLNYSYNGILKSVAKGKVACVGYTKDNQKNVRKMSKSTRNCAEDIARLHDF